jgi:Putative beta-barrel porin-2, OmpL-like. bbp2
LRIRFLGFLGCLMGLLLVLPVAGQDTSSPAPAEPAAAAPAAPQGGSAPTWSVGPIDFSGAVDVYYTYNANHPASMTNGLYNFNSQANQFDLSLLKIAMSHDADPVGFRVDLGYGNTMQLYSSLDNDGGFNQYVEQAFVSWKPGAGKGFQADFGKFVTSAGAEVVESYSDWSYSRSILFAWAIPYYHTGLRLTLPAAGPVTLGFQVVNGWNNLRDNNSGKTIGATSAIALGKMGTWYLNYYAGPEAAGTNTGWRHLVDTTVSLTPVSPLSLYLNYDYGQDRSPGPLAVWQGFAGALHYQANSHWAFTGRGEWFQDRNGFSTGTVQKLKEVTFTGEYKLAEGLLTRAEYRHDWSDVPFFERGPSTGISTKQDTFTIGVVAFFGPMR